MENEEAEVLKHMDARGKLNAAFIAGIALNAVYVAVGAILVGAISKLMHPTAVNGDTIAWVATTGVVVNGVTAWLFMKDKNRDMNVKAAYLHMAADTLVSLGVVVSGIVIHFTGWYVLDPIVGIVIALVIAWSTRGLLAESTRLSIDAVPKSVDMNALERAILSVDGVKSIHHLHVWPLSTTEVAMTVHVIITDVNRLNYIIASVRSKSRQHGVSHPTVEAETETPHIDDHLMFDND